MAPMTVAATYQAVPAEEPKPVETAQAAPVPAPEPQAAPAPEPAPAEPAPATAAEPAPAPALSADREMPDTAANWLLMLLGGGALSGVGLALRRQR